MRILNVLYTGSSIHVHFHIHLSKGTLINQNDSFRLLPHLQPLISFAYIHINIKHVRTHTHAVAYTYKHAFGVTYTYTYIYKYCDTCQYST